MNLCIHCTRTLEYSVHFLMHALLSHSAAQAWKISFIIDKDFQTFSSRKLSMRLFTPSPDLEVTHPNLTMFHPNLSLQKSSLISA